MVLGNPIPSSVDPIGWLFFIWYIMLDLDCHFRCTSLPRFLAMLLSQATNTQRRWQWMATDLALQIQRIVVDCWESKLVQKMTWFWMRNLSQDSSGKWRFIGIHSKNVAILVVIVPGGSNPIVWLLHITTKVCRFHGSQFIQFHSNEKTQMNKTWASILYFAFTKKHNSLCSGNTGESTNLQYKLSNCQTAHVCSFELWVFEMPFITNDHHIRPSPKPFFFAVLDLTLAWIPVTLIHSLPSKYSRWGWSCWNWMDHSPISDWWNKTCKWL